MKAESQGKLICVQILRAIAALLVVYEHICHAINEIVPGRLNTFIHGVYGVEIFFVISGFIMYYIASERFGAPGAPKRFLKDRIIRIVPLYWFYTVLWLGAAFAIPTALTHNSVTLDRVIGSFLFWPMVRPEDGHVEPLLALGWSLNYEMYFYIWFAVSLFLPRRYGVAAFVAFFALSTALWPFISAQPFLYWASPIVLEFVGGLLVAVCLKHTQVMDRLAGAYWFVIVLVLLFVVGYLKIGNPSADAPLGSFVGGVIAIAIVAATLLQTKVPNLRPVRFMERMGDASYSLYLSHPFTLQAALIVLKRLGLFDLLDPLSVALVLFALSIAGGFVSYYLVEQPLVRLLKSKAGAKPAAAMT